MHRPVGCILAAIADLFQTVDLALRRVAGLDRHSLMRDGIGIVQSCRFGLFLARQHATKRDLPAPLDRSRDDTPGGRAKDRLRPAVLVAVALVSFPLFDHLFGPRRGRVGDE